MSVLPKLFAALSVTAAGAYTTMTIVTINKTFGGSIPSTCNKEWADATAEYLKALPRESNGGAVYMNPIMNGTHPYPVLDVLQGSGSCFASLV
eukprot:3052574-Pyramimonas_sp.AAC.1